MEYDIALDERELGIVSSALAELPFRIAAPLVAKINRQIAEQQDKRRAGSGSESDESGA